MFAVQAQPPFQVLSISGPFIFPRFLNVSAKYIQFVSGCVLSKDGGSIILTYGERDCVALEIRLPLRSVFGSFLCSVQAPDEEFARCSGRMSNSSMKLKRAI